MSATRDEVVDYLATATDGEVAQLMNDARNVATEPSPECRQALQSLVTALRPTTTISPQQPLAECHRLRPCFFRRCLLRRTPIPQRQQPGQQHHRHQNAIAHRPHFRLPVQRKVRLDHEREAQQPDKARKL